MKRAPITTVKTVVEAIDDGGAGIKLFTLTDPDHWELPPFRPGAHIDLHLPGGLVRTYSLCNDPADAARYRVAVKREAEGRGGSILLHDGVKVGDTIGVSLPRGGLVVDKAAASHVFVAGGIGITPYLSMANALQRIGHPDFRVHLVVRDQVPLEALVAPLMRAGRIVLHRTTAAGRPDIGALLGPVAPDAVIGVCGPETMIADFERAAAGRPQENVHVERFVPPPLVQDPTAKPYTLVLAQSRREVAVGAGQSMLTALQAAGVDVASSCCGGLCGACKVGWLEGRPVHRDRVLSPYERERYLMACVAGSDAERLVLDL
ncbi:MAG: PDR/VanB family oxidoreductase [Bradyrhizobium sp.]